MNFSQLETFLVLAQTLSITKTAEKTFCTQPAVSIKIRNLEQQLNTLLFERINNRLFLTEQGRIYQKYVRQALNLLETAKTHLDQFNDPTQGNIKLGASHFVGVFFLPQLMANYKKSYPNVNISLDISSSQQLIQKLADHQLDLLIMSDQIYFDPHKYELKTFLDDELILIVPNDHWLATEKGCTFDSLRNETLLTKQEHSNTRLFLEKRIHQKDKIMPKLLEINSLEGIKQGVIYGLGIGIIPKIAVKNELKFGLIKEVKVVDIEFNRKICFVHQKDKYLSPTIRQFLDYLVKVNIVV
ncbi:MULTISPECIES: LysR family transcriptional regulator [Lonepinella]|uniref:DNA-binding transcriptional LysR family regulator n=1 Tax=Lonepinella koalarum TaxID=53417 RepID=A0A4R1KQ85_9PAST|nr:LysR family transcriptional regulator [Lonepinella koalarum]MDH2925612.1 LysR family transcriptional regulator [Lonepinella koalarum]TCK67194.1 DNA-binding transcriptional LysR family regulator [Lonepinella koalarum]TFJ89148.1 LysR family transcriptional regulator [Lonepinella koalarum]